MKSVLVTGSSGLLGSACVRAMQGEYMVLSRPSGAIDLRSRSDADYLIRELRPDYVIHCAARVGGVKANRDRPVEFIEENVLINGNVISACHRFGVQRLVNIGTSCMFPKDAQIPVKESSFQTGPLAPDVEAYASAKILAHITCKAYRHQYGCRFITVCPANLYGPNDNYGSDAHVIPALIRKAFEAKRSGQKMKVWGDGSATREFLHSDDAARAIKIALEKYDSDDLLSIGSGVSTSIMELATMISLLVGANGVEWLKTEPTGIQDKTFDVSRLKALGWSQQIGLFNGISSVCDDYEDGRGIRIK